MSTVHYSRTGGHQPPQDYEVLKIDGNDFTLWRSVGWATYPPTPIGRFTGQLDFNTKARLQTEMAAVKDSLSVPLAPGEAAEKINLPHAHASVGIHYEAENSWGNLIDHLRLLLSTLTTFPNAAIRLEVSPDGQTARLVHLGTDPIRLDLSDLTVRAVLWNGYLNEGDWYSPEGVNTFDVKANVGWSLKLPFNHKFEVKDGYEVVAYVTFSAFDGRTPVPVSLESPRVDSNQ